MTTLDELPWGEATTPATPTGAGPRRHRHQWDTRGDGTGWYCRLCGRLLDPERARRGRSARRLGHDGERRSRDRYGFTKVGQYGGITDLRGKLFKCQQKTSRRAAPPKWQGVFAELDRVVDGRVPVLLLSFVRQGVATSDFFVVRGEDWLALHGKDGEVEG